METNAPRVLNTREWKLILSVDIVFVTFGLLRLEKTDLLANFQNHHLSLVVSTQAGLITGQNKATGGVSPHSVW